MSSVSSLLVPCEDLSSQLAGTHSEPVLKGNVSVSGYKVWGFNSFGAIGFRAPDYIIQDAGQFRNMPGAIIRSPL